MQGGHERQVGEIDGAGLHEPNPVKDVIRLPDKPDPLGNKASQPGQLHDGCAPSLPRNYGAQGCPILSLELGRYADDNPDRPCRAWASPRGILVSHVNADGERARRPSDDEVEAVAALTAVGTPRRNASN